jgi:fermentation-respiration switch protein FrsA (DUF1100 family)
MGFSAGAAVSICVAARDSRVTAVVSCACPAEFRFIPDREAAEKFIAHLRSIHLIRDAGFPPSVEEWMEGFRAMAAVNWVGRISPRPLLLVHGDRDDVVPMEHARILYERAGHPKELQVFSGAGHRLRRDPRVVEAAIGWLGQVNRAGHGPAC